MTDDKFSDEIMSDDELDMVAGGTGYTPEQLQEMLDKQAEEAFKDASEKIKKLRERTNILQPEPANILQSTPQDPLDPETSVGYLEIVKPIKAMM